MSSKIYMIKDAIVLVSLIILMLIMSCDGNSGNKFSLSGTTNMLDNGSKVYLDIDESTTLDSVIVENGRFLFRSNLPESPMPVVLRNEDLTQYRFIWVENKQMAFEAIEIDFKDAIVTGSETDSLSIDLINRLNKLSDRDMKIIEIEFIENNINSILSSYLLSENCSRWGLDKTKELYSLLSIYNKKSRFGREVGKFIQMSEY